MFGDKIFWIAEISIFTWMSIWILFLSNLQNWIYLSGMALIIILFIIFRFGLIKKFKLKME